MVTKMKLNFLFFLYKTTHTETEQLAGTVNLSRLIVILIKNKPVTY